MPHASHHAFDLTDVHVSEIDPDRVTTWQAWHTFRVDCPDGGQGSVLVLDAAIRYAHLLYEPERLRRKIADRLNAMVHSEGRQAVIARLRDDEQPLRLDDLWN
jgi:hypothetical protein